MTKRKIIYFGSSHKKYLQFTMDYKNRLMYQPIYQCTPTFKEAHNKVSDSYQKNSSIHLWKQELKLKAFMQNINYNMFKFG